MRSARALLCAVLMLTLSQGAEAGRTAAGRGARSSALGSSSVASTKASRSASGITSRGMSGARLIGPKRSLLTGGAQPSPRLITLIRDRERSGIGFVGVALLVSLLSQHDLSESERRWISNKIETMQSSDDYSSDDALQPALLTSVQFAYAGLIRRFPVGQAAQIRVTATSADGKPLSVACSLPGAQVAQDGLAAEVRWVPDFPSGQVLTCKAGAQRDRRLLWASPS